MLRGTASVLLVGGLALMVTWGVRPAESQLPPRPLVVGDDVSSTDELDGLRLNPDRLGTPEGRSSRLDQPVRDPFHFGATPRVAPVVAIAPPEIVEPPPAAPNWPALVAILTKPDSDRVDVALANAAGDLVVTAVGGRFGAFVVTEVSADAVVVVDTVSGASSRLAVR